MAEIKQYTNEELDYAINKLKNLSYILNDEDAKAINVAIWCIEKERYDSMDERWKNVR